MLYTDKDIRFSLFRKKRFPERIVISSNLSVRVTRQWNDIPDTVRNYCTTLNSFKKNYDDFYEPNRQQTIFEGR